MEENNAHNRQPSTEVSPTGLEDMPFDIMERIVKPLDATTKKSLRLTSNPVKTMVDLLPQVRERITVTLADNVPEIYIELLNSKEDRFELEFVKTKDGCLIRNPAEAWEKRVISTHDDIFVEEASKHFIKLVGKGPTTVKNLVFHLDCPYATDMIIHRDRSRKIYRPVLLEFKKMHVDFLRSFKNHLNRLDRRLKVKHVTFVNRWDPNDSVAQLMPFLEPGTLEKITWLCGRSAYPSCPIDKLEQFRRAKVFVTDGSFKAEEFGHFQHTHLVQNFSPVDPMLNDILTELAPLRTDWQTVKIQYSQRMLVLYSLSLLVDLIPTMDVRTSRTPILFKMQNGLHIKIDQRDETIFLTKIINL